MSDIPDHPRTQLGLPPTTPGPQGLDVLVGTVIAGRYRIDAPLGAGGMGTVFDGHHLGLDRAIAVKVLRPEFVADPQVSSRFEREAQAVSRLDHPCVVQVFDVGTAEVPPLREPVSFIVMERLQGRELGDVLSAPLPELVALDYLRQILDALAHAHSRGVVHRDLKPENIFVTRDAAGTQRLKLVDFGIAKMLEPQDGAVLTQLGMVFGTPGYMSPEQCIGAPVDARSDLYSAGIVFFEMLTGHCPFAAADMMEVLRMHINAPLPAVPGIGEFATSVLHRLTRKKPSDRYATADEVHAALVEHLASPSSGSPATASAADLGAAHQAGPPVATPSAVPPPDAHPRSSMAWVGALAALGVLSALVWALWPETIPETTPAAVTPEADPAEILATEEARIEDLIAEGEREAAAEALRTLSGQHPGISRLHWRLAEVTGDPKRPSKARATAIVDALRLDARRLEDASARAFVMGEARRRSVPSVLVEGLLEHGAAWTPQWIQALLERKHYALPHAQRHRLLDAWAQSPALTESLRRHQYCLDLWQAPDTETPCAVFDTALAAMAEHPSADYHRSLHAAPVPDNASGEPRCKGLAQRRDALRKELQGADGDADYVPADYASRANTRVDTKRRGRQSGRSRPLRDAVKSILR